MSSSKAAQANLDLRAVLDALGQGVVLFDSDGQYVMDNFAARTILGANLSLVRSGGWKSLAALVEARRGTGTKAEPNTNDLRERALRQTDPVRFAMLLGGAYIPCWMAAVHSANGMVYTMVTLEQPDWKPLSELLSIFRSEARMSISSTQGHAELIQQLAVSPVKNMSVEAMGKRVIGFAEIIVTHMYRLQLLVDLMQRLETIRTGTLVTEAHSGRRKLFVAEFVEDFLEELAEEGLVEPSRAEDVRERLIVDIPGDLGVHVPPSFLGNVLRDLLRNAVQYSPARARVILRATRVSQGQFVQIDVIDEGYGIRAKETERIFAPFQRARQPQIIGEFGYGLSLYCAKAEIEALGGRLWFESEEGVGSTFSFKLPIAHV
ncbi:MAG: sensor histidine kinase [Aggregatilineales bacterium]